jgi:hypothetical protein
VRAATKRVFLATAFGALTGCVCYAGRYLLFDFENSLMHFIWIVLNRTMVGYVIGISRLQMHWALHGMLIGATVGALFPYFVLLTTGDLALAAFVYLLSILFGLTIEFFATRVFHAARTV